MKVIRPQLRESMLDDYGYIVSMAHKEYMPKWLTNSSKYCYWDVKDPRGKDHGLV